MDIRFHTVKKSGIRCDVLIIPTFSETASTFSGMFGETVLRWLGTSPAVQDHTSAMGELTVCYGPADTHIPRVILVGMGKKDALTLEGYRRAIAQAVRKCKDLRLGRLCILVDYCDPVAEVLGKDSSRLVRETVLATRLADYSFTAFRSVTTTGRGKKAREQDSFQFDSLTLAYGGKTVPAALRAAVRLAEAEAEGICLARDLVNTPSNVMTPTRLGDEAVALAKRHGFSCRIIHKAEMAKLGMGALLAVAEGSHKEPRFAVLEYIPAASRKKAPVVLVGKGITFDTGGISLKPAAGMHHMRGDMAGAAAVLGAFEAIGRSREQVARPVVGILPLVENMPGGNATRPGDVVTTMSGKTVEILNTDAEGRLILCDALTYAQKNWKPAALVDVATLTGACVVALGNDAGGLFCTDDALRDTLAAEGETSGETLWPMPLWEHFRESLKSDIADMANVGGREGGAIAAAVFLRAFVEGDTPWAHLDIAGPGHSAKATPLCPSGGTGFGVRALYALAREFMEKKPAARSRKGRDA